MNSKNNKGENMPKILCLNHQTEFHVKYILWGSFICMKNISDSLEVYEIIWTQMDSWL